jgi:hypothetical protein
LTVVATDRAGNRDATPAVQQWTVDATAPGRPRVRGPHRTSKRRPSFHFSASDALTARGELQFLCSVDSPKLRRCSSVYRPLLRAGRHLLRVAAVDKAGNRSALTRFSVVVNKR